MPKSSSLASMSVDALLKLKDDVGEMLSRKTSELKKQLQRLAASLSAKHPGAAASLREGLEDTLTVQALGITGALYLTLRTTNPIENLNGSIAHFTRNVKRWKDGQMTLRWIAGALSDAKGRFRKLRGYREMKTLLAALKAKSANIIDAERKAA